MKSRVFQPEIIIILIVAAILTYVLIIPPIIGVADNGDFTRIMGSTGLGHLSENPDDWYFGYVNSQYKSTYSPISGVGYFSTELILIGLSKLISRIIFWHQHIFDIRSLAVIYSTILLISMFILIKFNRQRHIVTEIVLILLLILIFVDVGYISYFNSLYGEAVSFSFLLLTISLALYLVKQDSHKLLTLILFFISTIVLVGAKAQNAPIGIIFAIFSTRLLKLTNERTWKKVVITFSIFLVLLSVAIYSSVPKNFKICNKYQTVFYGILKDSPTPGEDLKAFDLDPKYSVLAGTNYFLKEYPIDIKSPSFQEIIYKKVNPFKVTIFYIKHPSRLWMKLNNAASYGFKIVEGYGNYERCFGIKYGQTARHLGIWSNFKINSFPQTFIFVATFFFSYFIVLAILHLKNPNIKNKLYYEVLILIGVIGIVEFLVPIIGDGDADLSKHLFLFNVCFDAMFIISIVWIIHNLSFFTMLLNRKLINVRK